jgi:hypothetical protein
MIAEHRNIIDWARKLIARNARGETVSKPDLDKAKQIIKACCQTSNQR